MRHAHNDSSLKPLLSIDIDSDEFNLLELHSQVLRRTGRVELTRNGDSCVLISKSELDALEKALEMLSDNDTMRAIRDQIAVMAQVACNEPLAPVPSWAQRGSLKG